MASVYRIAFLCLVISMFVFAGQSSKINDKEKSEIEGDELDEIEFDAELLKRSARGVNKLPKEQTTGLNFVIRRRSTSKRRCGWWC